MNEDTSPTFDFDAVFEVDDYLYFYSESLTDERTETEVAAIVTLAELKPGMTILDLACGFGRHTNRLAQMGYTMTGVDLMPGFLDLARKDAAARGVTVDYRQGDMRQLDFEAAFERVFLLFTAFGYFDDEDNLRVLQNCARALKPGGLLIFDVQNRDTALVGFRPSFVTEKEGNLMIDRMTFDPLTGKMTNRRIVIRDGTRKDKPFIIRLYNPTEIHDWLERAGLEVDRLCGGWDGAPLSSESRRMVVVARKRVNAESQSRKGSV